MAFAPLAFIAVLAGGWSAAETYAPEITDTPYHHRAAVLRDAAASHPRNPLGIVIGSSRLVWGFRPEILDEPPPGDILWVNGSQVGGGPILNRLMFHRLLRDGVKPSFAVIEVMPAFYVRENTRFVVEHLAASEMPTMRVYGKFSRHYDYYYLRHRVWRLHDIARVFDPFDGAVQLLPRGGHPHTEEDVTPAERARRTDIIWNVYHEDLQRLIVRPGSDRAFRDMLTEARTQGVRIVLLRTPESSTFKSWYDPAGSVRFDAYLGEVAREFGVPILDARDWLEDNEFHDTHHALRRGADKFTTRFAREIKAFTDQ